MDKESKNAWVLRLDTRLDTCLAENVIAIGWADAPELRSKDTWETFRQHVVDRYPWLNDETSKSIGMRLGSLWRFVREMDLSDQVVVPAPDGFYVAKIVGNAEYQSEWIDTDMAWCRQVEWVTERPTPRDRADADLRRRMKARQTCVQCTELIPHIERALDRDAPVAIGTEVLSQGNSLVMDVLWKSVDDRGVEELVKKLAIASGAEAYIPPKRQGGDGDLDVVAQYGIRIPLSDARVTIGFQVKEHQEITDQESVEQLKGPLIRGEIHQGCVVTTARTFSQKAMELAEQEPQVLLIDGEMLAEWVLGVGMDKLESD